VCACVKIKLLYFLKYKTKCTFLSTLLCTELNAFYSHIIVTTLVVPNNMLTYKSRHKYLLVEVSSLLQSNCLKCIAILNILFVLCGTNKFTQNVMQYVSPSGISFHPSTASSFLRVRRLGIFNHRNKYFTPLYKENGWVIDLSGSSAEQKCPCKVEDFFF
jgi:hypothetical protein